MVKIPGILISLDICEDQMTSVFMGVNSVSSRIMIDKLDLPEKIKRWQGQRCCRIVSSTGTHYFDDNKNRCARMARFRVNGINLCTQHAGEAALRHLISEQENTDDNHNL